jgi:hypothetical protein
MEQLATQPLQSSREYQPNVRPSPSSTYHSNQALYAPNSPSLKLPIQHAVYNQPPYPARKYPNFNLIAGTFLLIIILVGGSLFLITNNIFWSNSTKNANVTNITTPTPTPIPSTTSILSVPLAPPDLIILNLTLNPDGTQTYNVNIQAKDKNDPTKPITADGITCRLWLVPQGADPQTDPGTHFLTTAADQLQHVEKLNRPFPQEIPNALLFDPPTTSEIQPCVQGSAKWKFTTSPSLAKSDYWLVGLTDWQGKNYNWVWIKISTKKPGT